MPLRLLRLRLPLRLRLLLRFLRRSLLLCLLPLLRLLCRLLCLLRLRLLLGGCSSWQRVCCTGRRRVRCTLPGPAPPPRPTLSSLPRPIGRSCARGARGCEPGPCF